MFRKSTISYEIIKYLELYPKGLWGGEIENYVAPMCRTKGSTVSRELRRMVEEDKIVCEKRQVQGKGAWVNYYLTN